MRLRSFLFLTILVFGSKVVCGQQAAPANDCEARLARARSYEIANDKRAEKEFKLASADEGSSCPVALFELSQHFSRRLRFREAAEALKNYIQKTPDDEHVEDMKEMRVYERAAIVKNRVENSERPSLQDLVELTKFADGYGRRKTYDALPFAEKAVSLYPESVDALLLVADLLRVMNTHNDRVDRLLNQAATIEPNNPRVRSMRGWFYLFSVGRRGEAEDEFRRALSLSSEKDSLSWKGLGYVLMFKGQKQQAIAAFRTYLSMRQAGEPDTEVGTLIEELKRDPTP